MNYNYVTKIAEKILPNSLCYELANDVSDNHEQQISWIINQLENIKSRPEKARLIGFNKKERQPDMMRTTLNFIERVEQNEYNNQQQKENPITIVNKKKNPITDRIIHTTKIVMQIKIIHIEVIKIKIKLE